MSGGALGALLRLPVAEKGAEAALGATIWVAPGDHKPLGSCTSSELLELVQHLRDRKLLETAAAYEQLAAALAPGETVRLGVKAQLRANGLTPGWES